MKACQDTLNRMWGVPRYRRPGFVAKLWRSIAVFALLGFGVIGTAVITGLTLGLELPLLGAGRQGSERSSPTRSSRSGCSVC